MNEPAKPIGELDLGAYLDGALTPERRAEVERHLALHPAEAAQLAEDRRIGEALRRAYDPVLSEPVPERLRRAAERRATWPEQVRRIAAALLLFALGSAAGWVARSLFP